MPYSVINDKKGFSLTEVMIVIALISILSGTAVISIKSNLPQYYLSGAARQVITDLMLARMQAVSKNLDIPVTFSNISSSYTISGVKTKVPSQYKGVSLSSSGSITFKPSGISTSPVTITLTGSTGLLPKYVDVSVAGRARIR